MNNTDIEITKKYWPFSPFYIKIQSPLISFDGIELKNSNIILLYQKKEILIKNFESKLVEGNINFDGKINLEEKMPFAVNGNLNNISLNTILNQLDIAQWNRPSLKISSDKFLIEGNASDANQLINSIMGYANISGSAYFISTDEERFGAALLSLLVEKIPNIAELSDSINFVLSTYGNVPTTIKGEFFLKNRKINTKNLEIKNDFGKSIMNASLNLDDNNIDGKIIFYKDNNIYLETFLKGNISNPKLLVGEKILGKVDSSGPMDIKKIFENGINSLIDKLLNINE